jgi:hypothetical protein
MCPYDFANNQYGYMQVATNGALVFDMRDLDSGARTAFAASTVVGYFPFSYPVT